MLVKWNELIMEAEWKKQIIYKDRKLLTVDIRIRVYINNIYIYIYTHYTFQHYEEVHEERYLIEYFSYCIVEQALKITNHKISSLSVLLIE